jgi:hypothetical protein
MTSKYEPLRENLAKRPRGEFTLTFKQIEEILGFRLPQSAARPQWWANVVDGHHSQTKAWREAGFDAFLIDGSKKVRF